MDSCIPTLTLDGFVKNKQMIFYKLWEYFLTSEKSQSNTYGDIASYKYILATGLENNDEQSIVRTVESSLYNLYHNYFDNVQVSCELGTDPETSTLFVKIDIMASDTDGKTYRLAKEIENSNGEIKNYNTLLNELYEHYATTYN